MTFKEKYSLPPEEWGRFDTREFIKKRMAEEGVTITELADKLGMLRPNLSAGLHARPGAYGKRTKIPFDKLEVLLWLFGSNI